MYCVHETNKKYGAIFFHGITGTDTPGLCTPARNAARPAVMWSTQIAAGSRYADVNC
jgi:hypothetical protein